MHQNWLGAFGKLIKCERDDDSSDVKLIFYEFNNSNNQFSKTGIIPFDNLNSREFSTFLFNTTYQPLGLKQLYFLAYQHSTKELICYSSLFYESFSNNLSNISLSDEHFTKCFTFTCSAFESFDNKNINENDEELSKQQQQLTVEVICFDNGPSFLLKQNNHFYLIYKDIYDNINYQVCYCNLNIENNNNMEDEENQVTKIVYSGNFLVNNNENIFIVVLASIFGGFKCLTLQNNGISNLCDNFIPLLDNNNENNKIKFISSYSSVCTCMNFYKSDNNDMDSCRDSNENWITIIGSLEKEIIFIQQDGRLIRTIKLNNIPLKILTIEFEKEQYLIVHLQNYQIEIYSLFDFEKVKQLDNVKDIIIDDFISNGRNQLLFIHYRDNDDNGNIEDNSSFEYMLLLDMNVMIKDGNIVEEESSTRKGVHLYSVLRALTSQIENSNQLLLIDKDKVIEKQSLLKHQHLILKEMLNDMHNNLNCNNQQQGMEDEEESNHSFLIEDKGIKIPLGSKEEMNGGTNLNNNNNDNSGDRFNSFYQLDSMSHTLEKELSKQNSSTLLDNSTIIDSSKVILNSAAQSFNSKNWNIHSEFSILNNNSDNNNIKDKDILLIPVSTNTTLETTLYKKEEKEEKRTKVYLTSQIKTPTNYSDSDLSIHCLLVKRSESHHKFEYLGNIQPNTQEKLFCLPHVMKETNAELISWQLLFCSGNNNHMSDISLERMFHQNLSQIFISKLQMKQISDKIFEFNSTTKGYTSTLYYRITILYINNNIICCNLQCDSEESLLLILQQLSTKLSNEIIILPFNLNEEMIQKRINICSKLNEELNIILNNIHKTLINGTTMNPLEEELRTSLLTLLKKQTETDEAMLNALS
ncbi:hypothetical protein ABK040_013385 [Willaertia magna]